MFKRPLSYQVIKTNKSKLSKFLYILLISTWCIFTVILLIRILEIRNNQISYRPDPESHQPLKTRSQGFSSQADTALKRCGGFGPYWML